MRFELEGGFSIEYPSPVQLREALTRMDGDRTSFAILEDISGSYIQAGGGPTAFTVEVRKTLSEGLFRHFKATRLEEVRSGIRHLYIGREAVRVRRAEVLPIDLVQVLFDSFLSGDTLTPDVHWADITSMFTGGGDSSVGKLS